MVLSKESDWAESNAVWVRAKTTLVEGMLMEALCGNLDKLSLRKRCQSQMKVADDFKLTLHPGIAARATLGVQMKL